MNDQPFNNPLIVTHISTVHAPFDSRIFHKECKSLAASGMKVNLITTHNKKETIDNIQIIPLPEFKNRFTRIFIKSFLAFLKALKTKANIFHFHDPELIFIGLLLKLLGKRVIYDVHEDVASDILDKYWLPKHLRCLISFIFSKIEYISSKFFDGIITSTPHIKNIFLNFNKSCININNYPIIEENKSDAEINNSQKEEKIISYVGGISKERGIFELLKAIQGTDIKLHLAGTISPCNLLETLEKEEGWKNVVYFGHLGRNEVYSLMSSSQIGICTLYPTNCFIHSLPIKIFEYMNAGIPIIVSKFPYWESLLKDIDNALFVDPLNPNEIQNAIKTLLADNEKRIGMSERGLTAVREVYNWNIEKEKLITFYNTL